MADYLLYTILIFSDVHYSIAILVGYSVGFILNLWLGRMYVFAKYQKPENIQFEIIMVFTIAIVGLGLNLGFLLWITTYTKNIGLIEARAMAIVMVFFWNYFMRRWLVYH